CARRDRTTVPASAAIAVTAISSASSPAVFGYSRALAAKTATSAAPPAAAAYHARAARRPQAPAAYSASHPAYGGTPGTITALTAYASTHTASTLTGRDRRHTSAPPPISAAAIPTVPLAAPASKSEARTGLPARGAASCSAVTSTTSSTFPARAQRRRGAGWLTAAPVSPPQRTSQQTFHTCRGPACRDTPDYPIPGTADRGSAAARRCHQARPAQPGRHRHRIPHPRRGAH